MTLPPLWLIEKLWIPSSLRAHLKYDGPILFIEHHESHAASAFYASPFERAAILTMDGVGEWVPEVFSAMPGQPGCSP
jgi:carbamoyltransferase